MTQTNRHPVDELADIRAETKRLKEREDELRKLILSRQCTLAGDENVARITERSSSRLDIEAVRKHYGMKELAPFAREVLAQFVFVDRKAEKAHLCR
jgi:hypothetical protein